MSSPEKIKFAPSPKIFDGEAIARGYYYDEAGQNQFAPANFYSYEIWRRMKGGRCTTGVEGDE